MLGRRGFIQAIASIAALGAAASPGAAKPNEADHQVGQWRVRWMGWRTPANQAIKFGFWLAYHATDRHRWHWVSTTLGHVGRYRDPEMIDTSLRRDSRGEWPHNEWDSAEAFTKGQANAYNALIERLRLSEQFDWEEWPPENNGFRPSA